MDCEARQKAIELLLLEEKKVGVEKLSKKFKVSEVTIRKDLAQMETRGVLLRTHGGIGVRPFRPTDRAEQHGGAVLAAVDSTVGQGIAHRVDRRTPDQLLAEFEPVAMAFGDAFEDGLSCRSDLRSDAVSLEHGDQGFHGRFSSNVRNRHVGWQPLVLAAQGIADPCAGAGKAFGRVAGIDEDAAGAVRVCLAVHRVDKRDVIHVSGHVRQERAEALAALACRSKRPRALHQVAILALKRHKALFAGQRLAMPSVQ